MQPQRAIGHVETLFQSRKVQSTVDLQGRENTQAHRAMHGSIKAVEIDGRLCRLGRHGTSSSRSVADDFVAGRGIELCVHNRGREQARKRHGDPAGNHGGVVVGGLVGFKQG